jgi:hypothetical protein
MPGHYGDKDKKWTRTITPLKYKKRMEKVKSKKADMSEMDKKPSLVSKKRRGATPDFKIGLGGYKYDSDRDRIIGDKKYKALKAEAIKKGMTQVSAYKKYIEENR